MKKLMKWIIAVVILVACGFGLWEFGEKWEEEKNKGQLSAEEIKEALDKTEDGSTYVYSEEEIAVFKEEAEKLMNKEVEEFDLQYGENKIVKLQENSWTDAEAKMLAEGVIDEETIRQDRERRRLNEYYTAQDLSNKAYAVYTSGSTPQTIFNEDLSLIKPYVFYGYTSVNNPSLEDLRNNPYFLEQFNYFVNALKLLDEKYKKTSSNKAVDILIDKDDVFIEDHYSKYDRYTGAVSYLFYEWESNQKENSLNQFQGLLRVEKLRKINNTIMSAAGSVYDMDNVDYEPLSSKFNYWEANEAEYFTLFWPSSVTKIDNYTYLVDIDTEKPVDRYGATIIAQNIQCRFTKTMEKKYEGEYFKLIVKIDDEIFHDMNQGIVLADVVNGYYMLDENNNRIISVSENTALWEWQAWSPSEEVRPWVDDYFSIAAEAFKNDTYFSIFETIEQIAEKYNAHYLDVENVIMSCYWTYNGHVNFY